MAEVDLLSKKISPLEPDRALLKKDVEFLLKYRLVTASLAGEQFIEQISKSLIKIGGDPNHLGKGVTMFQDDKIETVLALYSLLENPEYGHKRDLAQYYIEYLLAHRELTEKRIRTDYMARVRDMKAALDMGEPKRKLKSLNDVLPEFLERMAEEEEEEEEEEQDEEIRMSQFDDCLQERV